jgi:transcriptional regulator with XRE-family HTH domain
MEKASALASFLRARRELVKPADVGLPNGDRRRVEGLRREEVAMLAGISAEYYLRLEQGRDHQPSEQVLEGLARALQLDDDATTYLRDLARPQPPRRQRCVPECLDPAIQTLIDGWPMTAAFVLDRNLTVLASNGVARTLSRFFTPGQNLLRAIFLEPELRTVYRDWEAMTTRLVPFLRALLGAEPQDREMVELVGELSIASRRFRTLWARHDVKHRSTGPALFYHPQVGPLDMHYTISQLVDQRQMLVAYHAEPGSPSEERLRVLTGLSQLEPDGQQVPPAELQGH